MDAVKTYGFFALAAVFAVLSRTWTTGDLAPYALIPELAAVMSVCAGVVAVNTRFGVLATAAVNLAFSWYLFDLKVKDATGESACNIDAVFDCGAINTSPYSEIAGIPITLLGAGFYAALALAAMFAPRDAARFDRFTVLAGLFSVAYSLFLAWASKQVGAVCLFCISMYVGNAILLWAGFKGLRERQADLWTDAWGALTGREGQLVAIAVVIAAISSEQLYGSKKALPGSPADGGAVSPDALATLYEAPRGRVELAGTEPVLGSPDARYLVVEYADFGCPHCARAAKQLKDLVAAMPDVQVRYKYYPLSGPCNPQLEAYDETRCAASYAAECAHEQGRFWDMSNQLFTNQGYFAAEQLEFMAREIGLDVERWKACLDSPRTHEAVRQSAEAGNAAGIEGTPTMYLRGITGSDYVLVPRGAEAIAALVEAHRGGVALAAPGKP